MDNISSLQRLQQISQIACFSLDYQKKLQAQGYFLELSKKLSSPLITQIMSNGSDTLIFVTIEYVNKLIQEYSLEFLKQLFNTVQNQVSEWYVPEAHQFRRLTAVTTTTSNNIQVIEKKQVTKYVMNSISFFMSNCMKRFFLQQAIQKRSQIVQWINNRCNQRYKLWLFTIFIQNISQIDQSMGFIKFRSLSYNFQQQVIPIISKCIIPFLYKVEDIMKVNEISEMQQNLHVQQQIQYNTITKTTTQMMIPISTTRKQSKPFLNENEFKFAQLVFQLLHNLVFYNFHLTYTQYQQQATFENCLICFPEQFTAKVVNQQFIDSMGYVIQRLIDLMPRSKFLKTTLQCLQKIFLTKLSYVDQFKKLNFVKQCIIMLTKCMKKQNLDLLSLTKLIVCNNKFLNNIDISYVKEKSQLKQVFHDWLLTITKTTFFILENIHLTQQFNFNLQESLVIECLELYQKVVSSLCVISYVSFEEINFEQNQQKKYLIGNVQTMTAILLKKILLDGSKPLIQDSTAQIFKSNILEIKTFCSCFFQPFKQLASINYEFLFNEIERSMDYTLNTPEISVKFNLFMLLCEVMDRNFLQRNIITVKASDQEVFTLSKCINKALKFLDKYLKNKQQMILTEQIVLMDISILIFFDKVLSQFLGYFQNHESNIEIKHKIFLNILKIENKLDFNSNASEEFIMFCVQSVLSFLLIYNKSHQSNHINDFIFETINRILMKFKWGIKREVFKSSLIYLRLQQFFSHVQKETSIMNVVPVLGMEQNLVLFHQFQRLKWRKKLLKVIALLYFDDIIDDYRRNLQNIFISLKNEHILTILLDIQGIGEAIDTTSIYKSFLQMTEKYFSVNGLTSQLVKFACTFHGFDTVSQKYPKIKIIKEVVKMHKAILSNKGQRIGNPKNMQSVYTMIKDLIKYWIDFLRMSDSEEWLPVVREVINTISELIKCDKINFYLVQRVCIHNYVELFYQMFTKMDQMSQKIEQNPKFYEAYLGALVNISRELLEVIFFPSIKLKIPQLKEKTMKISQIFLQIFLMTFKRIPGFLQEFKIGNTKNEAYLEKSIQVVKFTLVFIDLKRRQQIEHKQEMHHINLFVQEMKQLIFTYCNQLLAYLSTQKHFSVHRRTLIILLYEASIIYPSLLQILILQMNLPQYLLFEAKQCLEFIKKQEQQLFIDRFKTWLRMIHMTEQEIQVKKEQHRDFYGFMGII